MMEQKKRVVGIIGPTAVGKTALSLAVAERLHAEIVSVDSRQVYRYMDVGTDKVSPDIRRKTIHHLLDVAMPDEVFSVADFVELSSGIVERVAARGRRTLFVGGTPFYFNALLEGTLTKTLPKDEGVRRRIAEECDAFGNVRIFARLMEVDPVSASRLHPRDVRRVSRSLEIYELTGKTAAWWYENGEKSPSPFDVLYIGLNRPRQMLYDSIEKRVRAQFASGFIEEVEWLLSNGFDEHFPSMQGFGYKEILSAIKGEMSFEDAALSDIASTKFFARKQMTWFRKFSPSVWYDTSGYTEGMQSLVEGVVTMCERFFEEGKLP